jgi:cytochrome P450
MQAITLDVILRAVFGVEESGRLSRLRERLVRFLALADGPSAAFLVIPPARVDLGPLSPWGRFVRRRRAVDEELFAEIAERRARGTSGRDDILSMLMDARGEDGRGLDDQELRDEMFTLLMAGHETTATSLAWAIYHLLRHPDVLSRLREEVRGGGGDGANDPLGVMRLEYLDAVVKESARLTPVVSNVVRVLKAPARIGGRDLPAGAIVSPSIYLAHRRPDLWPEPERFRPERFLGVRPSPHAFLPFGGGVRRCLGAAFAAYEMKVVLAQVVSRADLALAPGYTPRVVRRAVTHAPSRGVPVVVDALNA